jgi:hypothetical protein
MFVWQFINNFLKKGRVKIIQEENERLKVQLNALEQLKKKLEENHTKN